MQALMKRQKRKPKVPRKFNRQETFRIIQLYRENECLWNVFSPKYKRLDLKKSALEKIGKEFGIQRDEARIKIKNLRNTYVSERKKVLDSRKSGNEGEDLFQPTLSWYKEMGFLNSSIKLRKFSATDLEQQDDDEQKILPDRNSPEAEWFQESTPSSLGVKRKLTQENETAPEPSTYKYNNKDTPSETSPQKKAGSEENMYETWMKSLTIQIKELAKISPITAYDTIYKFQNCLAKNMLVAMKENETMQHNSNDTNEICMFENVEVNSESECDSVKSYIIEDVLSDAESIKDEDSCDL